ncbi:hypothetical protein K502DRAFT_361933 [Neoconidiobolus thromboides FSU 785]|nr:hypothetical protein K502DRAFT_361933 [Neoconidiobolus thromboides FSU 785]
MSNKKVIELNAGTILDLKAELARREEEAKKEHEVFKITGVKPAKKGLKKDVFDKSNVGIEKRKAMDAVNKDPRSLEDLERLELSKRTLEKKAKIYEKLLEEGKEFNEMDDNMLIDFEKKAWEQEGKTDNKKQDEDSEAWVEYIDEFGRTRVGRREEVESLKPRNDGPELLSKDMERELERQRWEKEMEEENANEYTHFDRDKELRNLGVGFYKFSKDEDERAEQIKELTKLRKETELKRSLHTSIQNIKKSKIEERINKVAKLREKRLNGIQEDIRSGRALTEDKIAAFLKKI